jgi:5-dehydro-2-deoxygluconokinase
MDSCRKVYSRDLRRRTATIESRNIWRSHTKFDVICLGRAAVDLYGDQLGSRLEDMQSFSKYLGGSPANTAFGCARLGLKPAMLTRVGDEHHGRFVREALAAAGVDVGHVITDERRLTALTFLAIQDRDTFPLLFYRENCADMALCVGDVEEDFIGSSRALLISGTHLSRPSTFEASLAAVQMARRLGVKVVLDIDYRPVLWGLTAPGEGERRFVANQGVSAHLQTVVKLCDLIVGTEEEINIAGGDDDLLASLRALRTLSGAVLVVKRGPAGCVVFDCAIPGRLEDGLCARGFPVEVFNVLGAGDSFMAGFLRGWLRDEPYERCCEYANACGAMTVSRHACSPAMATWDELLWFLAESQKGFPSPRLWTNSALDDVHRSTTREGQWANLAVFAFDHRMQLEELAKECGESFEKISQFKRLALRAALTAEAIHGGAKGILLDDRYGDSLLPTLVSSDLWIGRPVERPGSLPLRWDTGVNPGSAIRTWPRNHVAKCLVIFHPSQRESLQEEQIEYLRMLQDTCRATGHEWLLEVTSPNGIQVSDAQTERCLEIFYAAGLRPDWWKWPPTQDRATWQATLAVVERYDPHCRGVIVMGLDASIDELRRSFDIAPTGVRGFMVGRTIFSEVARLWFLGQIADGTAIERMRDNYQAVIFAWAQSHR